MFDFLNKRYPFNTDLAYCLKLALGMAIGIFLFILFFEPLGLNNTSFENYTLTIAGFAGITLLLISLVKIILPLIFRGIINIESWDLKREVFLQLLIWILNSVAFSFYLAYVGQVPMTMYLAFKVVLICLAMPVTLMLINEINIQKAQVSELHQRYRELQEQIGEGEDERKSRIEIYSDNRSEKLVLDPESLILIRSAENYVEIVYVENGSIQKKLLRTTMRSIEDQLRLHPEMVRCHRTCIINTGSVSKLQRTAKGITLKVIDIDEEIPVSRQYLLGVKAALEKPS
ncbi:LytTR family transcriptional regulator DNA-binding domain-containing protein [Bacteroidota bacterium]